VPCVPVLLVAWLTYNLIYRDRSSPLRNCYALYIILFIRSLLYYPRASTKVLRLMAPLPNRDYPCSLLTPRTLDSSRRNCASQIAMIFIVVHSGRTHYQKIEAVDLGYNSGEEIRSTNRLLYLVYKVRLFNPIIILR
jgi:hypothetical protein